MKANIKTVFKKGQIVYLRDLSKWKILCILGKEKNWLLIKLIDDDPYEYIDVVDIFNDEVFPDTKENRRLANETLEAKKVYEEVKKNNIDILIESWLDVTNSSY